MPEGKPDQGKALATALGMLRPESISSKLQEEIKTAESITTIRYIYNPAYPIKNMDGGGFKRGVHLLEFPRMDLIPLKVYKNPVIMARQGGFAVGSLSAGWAGPAGSVGSKIDFRLQYPSESVGNVLNSYGENGAQELGVIELRSLIAHNDTEKAEAELLWRAIMCDEEDAGKDYVLEDLPGFLASVAPRLLRRACEDGVRFMRSELDTVGIVYQLTNAAPPKGEQLIEEIAHSVAVCTRFAIDERSGVLPKTARELIASNKGQVDNKVMPDNRDKFFRDQFPEWSAVNFPDTSGMTGRRPQLSVTDPTAAAAVEASAQSNQTVQDVLALMRETLESNKKLADMNAQLMAQLQAAQPAQASDTVS